MNAQSTEKLDSGIELERAELSGVMGAEDDDEMEVLGRAMMYGVGDVLVPRDWLLQRCRALGIPERVIPSEPRPHSAYKRAQSRLVSSNPNFGRRTDRRYVEFEGIGAPEPLKVTLDLKDGSGNVNHLQADVFFPAGVVGEEGGKWVHHELGTFGYDKDSKATVAKKDDDCPEALEDLWIEMVERADRLHDEMQNHHTGDDIRHMVYYLKMKWTDTIVPLRDAGSVYFVPEGPLTDIIESLATIFQEVDTKFKEGGKRVEIRTLEVVDSDEKREWIEARVEQSLEKMVDDVLDEAFESLEEGDETVEEIVETVAERLDVGDDAAEKYNELLQAQLDVETILAKRSTAVEDEEKEELIDGAMEAVEV